MCLDFQVSRAIEGLEHQDLKVKLDLRVLWDQLAHQVQLALEDQANQVRQVSQESQVAQVEMVPLAPWDQWDLRDILAPQV